MKIERVTAMTILSQGVIVCQSRLGIGGDEGSLLVGDKGVKQPVTGFFTSVSYSSKASWTSLLALTIHFSNLQQLSFYLALSQCHQGTFCLCPPVLQLAAAFVLTLETNPALCL